ncbi:hypothetical protein ACT7DF_06100 [Bacillus cereus]
MKKIPILLSFLAIAGVFVFSVDKKLKSRNKRQRAMKILFCIQTNQAEAAFKVLLYNQ